MKKLLTFFAAVVVLAQTLRATTYYVSKSGSDSNGGTSTNAAFLTISKAASVMTNGDTCYILSGTYRENVTPAHSGTSSLPITFAAYTGATPIVSGADVMTNTWSVYTNSIYECTTTNVINQLFLDSYMMNIARWPNANVDELLYAPRSTPTAVSLTNVTDNNLPSGLSLVGAYVHFFDSEDGNPGYAASTRPITSWNSATKTFSWVTNVYRADSSGCLYYVYGDLSLLDTPTEWYQTNTTLYLWTPNSDSPGNHTIETKNRTNAFTLDNLSYVTLSNIYVFAAGISMAHTTNCVVNGCNLTYVQHDMTADYTRDVHIADQVSGTGSQWINSVIDYSSQDGIRLLGTNEVVSNCVIYNVDYYPGTYYGSVSPNSTNAGGITVINNTLWYSGRLCVGDSSYGNNNICSNDLGYGELLTSDAGATYMYGAGSQAHGTTIHHNWAHNCWAGVYLDNGQSGYVAYCNVCYSNDYGMEFNGFTNNLIINNTSVSNIFGDILFNGSTDVNVQLYNNLWHITNITASTNVTQTDNGWYPPINTNYIPMTGSGAINGGLIDAPYTDGYVGSAPDIGAFVGGSNTYWTPGANFVATFFPRSMIITLQPTNQTNSITQTATFSVLAEAPTAVTYQWQVEENGSYVNLSAGGQYSGVTSTNLTISSLALTNATNYDVIATSSSGSLTSAVVALTVTNLTYQAVVLFDGPAAYWPMQETNGPTIHDIVSTNNGTLVTSTDNNIGLGYHTNFVTAGSGATDGGTYLFGGAGGLTGVSNDTAIYFTNVNTSTSNSQIVIPYSAGFDPSSELTAEAWIKVPTYPIGYTNTAYQVPLGLEANATVQNGWWMAAETDSSGSEGDFQFNLAKVLSAGWTTSTSTSSLSGKWVYAVEVYTGSNTNLSCYTNGVLMASVTATTNYESEGLYNLHKLPFIIGSYCVSYNGGGTLANGYERGDFWHGAVSHVAIYTNALTAGQITNHYYYATNVGSPPSITSQPAGQTNTVGQTNTFTVSASGTVPLSYQWQVESNGAYLNLGNSGQYSGVTSTTLTVSSLTTGNNTNYDVVVNNTYGSVTSSAAMLTVLAYQTVVLRDAPVSYWPMQETNGPTINDIASTNNGTLVTSTDNNIGLGYHTNFVTAGSGATDGKTYLFGGPGGLAAVSGDTAIYFTNLNTSTSNSQIVVPYNAAIDPSTNLTAEAWINIPTYSIGYTNTTFQVPLGLEAFGGSENGWWMAVETDSSGSEGDFQFNIAQFPGTWLASPPTTTSSLAGNWVYAVEVYTGSNSNLLCYTNGVLMATVAMTAYYETEGIYGSHKLPFIIGSYSSPGGASGGYNGGGTSANGYERGNFWHGGISHVAIYNTALTASQITNHYYFATNGATGTAPSITSQPASATNYATQTATFSVSATDTSLLSYQWKVESSGSYVSLSNGGQYSGATTPTLNISSLAATNATNYEVVVTNVFGSVTSSAALLTVLNATPSITTQPANTTLNAGQTATFSVTAAGLPPLSYQWEVESNGSYVNLSNAGQFSGVTTSTLSISNLAVTNGTNYEVVVTNSAGSVTSSAALLTVTWYQTVILGDAPVSYWPMQETTGPTIKDIITTNAGPFNGTVQISTDGFTNGGTDGEGKVWGIIHETFTNSTSAVATDGKTYLFGGSGGLAGVSGDTAVYFTNLNGQLNSTQIAMGTNGTGVYESQLDSSNFTVEAWIKVPTYTIGWTSNGYQIPLSLNAYGNGGNTANGWFMGVKTDSSGSSAYGEMFFDAGTGTAFTSNGPSAQDFSGKWVYAVQEYNGTATVIYTNGTLMVSNTQTYKPLSNTSAHEEPLIIGSENAYYFSGSAFSGNTRADFWDGGVSHVAYYNYALSASKITNHYYYGTNSSFGSGGAFRPPSEPGFTPTIIGTTPTTPIGATLTPAVVPMSPAKQFQMQVSAVANQNYTLQICTDLSSGNWVSLYTTNSTTNTTFVLTDPDAATNKQRFYRVLIGP